MQNLQKELINLLKSNEEFIVDGEINKNKIIESSLKLDKSLLSLLLKSDSFKKHFFEKVDKILVFDKIKFQRFVSNKSFLPDSYTSFKNKIGLTINDGSNDNFIITKNDTVLAWPHKDCLLEGGQTKEDDKRNEIFWNETLAPDNVDRLLDAKAFTNFKKYDKDGEHKVTEFTGDENLILKGNNLLVLSSLLKTHRGKIKLIYIDPPYNTGSDSFQYNDSFNHSTWLTFMKNRLVIAKELLKSDGVIFVQCDDNEQAYLKVLLDEIFGITNNQVTLYIQVRFTNKTLSEDNDYQKLVEHLFVYSKGSFKPNKDKVPYSLEKFCYKITELTKGEKKNIAGRDVIIFKPEEYSIEKVKPTKDGLKATWATGSLVNQGGSAAEFFHLNLKSRKATDGLGVLYKVIGMGEKGDGLGYRYISGPKKKSAVNGLFYTGLPLDKQEKLNSGELDKEVPINNVLFDEEIYNEPYWDYKDAFGNCRTQGDVTFNSGKKPEQLLKRIIEISTREGDYVLDFHLGSGTTTAVAHKMKRKYIGIEQMSYSSNNNYLTRQINVINSDASGVSKEVNWQGGGSFVYAELIQFNQYFINKLQDAKTKEDILRVWEEMQEKAFLSYQFNKDIFNKSLDAFKTASFEIMQKYLIEVLDKNQLYVNYSEIEDTTFNVAKEDKDLNYSFYKK